jgi:hypothetical protein
MKIEVLDAHESNKFIDKFASTPESQLVKRSSDITIKAPLVLKIVSEEVIHKTEIGGVRIVQHNSEITESFNDLITTAKKHKISIKGILAQEFVQGQQIIIGLKKDETFGHIIAVGIGGIFTELFKDVSIRKCPIDVKEAQRMLNDLKAHKIFEGFRNINVNVGILKEALVNISKISQKHHNIKEMDINPFILNEKEGKAVDVRIVLEK